MEALLAALAPGGWGWAAVAAVGGLVVFLILATRAGVGRGHKDRTNAPQVKIISPAPNASKVGAFA
jgi:hypothetical protein